jgi:hypothetical protein
MIIESVNAFEYLIREDIKRSLAIMTAQRKSNRKPAPVSKQPSTAQTIWRFIKSEFIRVWPKNKVLSRLLAGCLAVIFLFVTISYSAAVYYMQINRDKPYRYGATFIPDYARYLGTDPEETFDAMINDMGFRHFRLVSYWKNIEAEKGTYDFKELDWQFAKAEQSGSKVSLAIGLRQPRWPECHEPSWAKGRPIGEWYPNLKTYMVAVIERYKNSPALDSYQLENEFFLDVFGDCPDFNRDRLVEEFNLVKATDPDHPVIVSRSNNIIGLPLGEPRPDISAVSVYKRVWDKEITYRYVEYPFPAWFYSSLAGGGKIMTGKDLIIHELQAEPWMPEGFDLRTSPLSEQDKTLSPDRLKDRIDYARATGIKEIDFWGVEWWYARKVVRGDSSVWDTAKAELSLPDSN